MVLLPQRLLVVGAGHTEENDVAVDVGGRQL